LRLCADMKLLSLKKHAELSELMDRIGKQIYENRIRHQILWALCR